MDMKNAGVNRLQYCVARIMTSVKPLPDGCDLQNVSVGT